MPEIKYSERLQRQLNNALLLCVSKRHQFMTPEHLLYTFLDDADFSFVLDMYCYVPTLQDQIDERLQEMEQVPANIDYDPQTSSQTCQILEEAKLQVSMSSATEVDMPHVTQRLLTLPDSWAAYYLKAALDGREADFISSLQIQDVTNLFEDDDEEDELDDLFNDLEDDDDDDELQERPSSKAWRRLVTCMNDVLDQKNPLIGREQELERTIQVLCRRDKNNPLHVGEPGVGKTALVYGLTARIAEGNVPERLKGAKVYMLDLGTLVAGTQYRGDFEKRVKQIMEGVSKEADNNIIYIDEIHGLVGSGATSDSSLDGSNMLKPYLESGRLRFIGSTTYEEYNRYFSRSKGLVRRFQQIDILEPSVEETVNILRQLCPRYETFHGITYDDEALVYAATASAKFVNDRFLPDKAIDLIDEAGAALECAAEKQKRVTKALIADVLAKTCKVDALAMKEDDTQQLATLKDRLLSKIYGQDEAVNQVVEAVQMAKAGLLDDQKPLASLLFVGPTGVGKTEVARQLARELGIELVRFDMSEYTEKHAVAKLIGSPAGYVGYEDGGLLTDAIRKTPNCVLLLDEIEKAHEDIYNILLQVMDYARLTDNKGRQADFRNVILLMTSNAGAQYAGQASIGFQGGVSRGEAMLRQVKKTFKPEFINRLSGTVVFHDMDHTMATLILRKKLRELQEKLTAKGVTLTLTDNAFEQLLNEGFTREYGAREMDRVITQHIKPLLTREILFGSLKEGGEATIDTSDAQFSITSVSRK